MSVHYLDYPHIHARHKSLCLAIGFFDGLHIGHQSLMKEVLEKAQEMDLRPAVMMFDPHPLEVLTQQPRDYITSLDDRFNLIKSYGIKTIYVINFTKTVAKLSPQQFIDDYLIQLNVRHLVCGQDFHFGHQNSGDTHCLLKQSFTCSILPPVMFDDHQKVSSTLIKSCLKEGQIEVANRYLSRPFTIVGEVIHGKKRGRQMGFPTANITYGHYCQLRRGVYAVKVIVHGRSYQGMANIGMNPTFKDVKQLSLEVNIFDFDQDIYGETVCVQFYTHTRDERPFTSIDALIDQLHHDRMAIKHYFS